MLGRQSSDRAARSGEASDDPADGERDPDRGGQGDGARRGVPRRPRQGLQHDIEGEEAAQRRPRQARGAQGVGLPRQRRGARERTFEQQFDWLIPFKGKQQAAIAAQPVRLPEPESAIMPPAPPSPWVV